MKIIASFVIIKTVEIDVENKTNLVEAIDNAREGLEQEYVYNINDWKSFGWEPIIEYETN